MWKIAQERTHNSKRGMVVLRNLLSQYEGYPIRNGSSNWVRARSAKNFALRACLAFTSVLMQKNTPVLQASRFVSVF